MQLHLLEPNEISEMVRVMFLAADSMCRMSRSNSASTKCNNPCEFYLFGAYRKRFAKRFGVGLSSFCCVSSSLDSFREQTDEAKILYAWTMMFHCASWCVMMHHEGAWFIMIHHDASWSNMTHPDTSWSIIMHHDPSYWIMIHYDASWCSPSSWRIDAVREADRPKSLVYISQQI